MLLKEIIKSYIPYVRRIQIFEHVRTESIKPKLDVTFKRISYSNCNDAQEWIGNESTTIFENKLNDNNQYGFFGYYGAEIVAYGWFVLTEKNLKIKNRNYLNLHFPSAYIECCAVKSEYQNKKIYQSMLCYMVNTIKGASIESIYIDTDSNNLSAQIGIEKAGFVKIELKKIFSFRSHFLFEI